MGNYVPGIGPPGAKLLIIGEAPGTSEELRGYPFAGKTGWYVRRDLATGGLDPESQVRYNNVFGRNVKVPKDVGRMKELVHAAWENVSDDLKNFTGVCIVACGRAAHYRLTGRVGILNEHGSCWRSQDLTTHVAYGGRLVATHLPADVVVVASLHPSYAMHSKTGAPWLRIHRQLQRAARYGTGELVFPAALPNGLGLRVRVTTNPDPTVLDRQLALAHRVAIDTEFDPRTNVPYLIGLSVDGEEVFSLTRLQDYKEVLAKHLMRKDLEKIAHYHVADTAALAALGVDTCGPWFDTLEGFSHLYPDLPVGLVHASMYYFPHLSNWKWMDHGDPVYNAIDTVLAWKLAAEERLEMLQAGHGMLEAFENERMPCSVHMALLRDRGLATDDETRLAKIQESHDREQQLLVQVSEFAKDIYERRIQAVRNEAAPVKAAINNLVWPLPACPVKKHEEYRGERKKKWMKNPECQCAKLFAVATSSRTEHKTLKKQHERLVKQAVAWDKRGFDPGNSYDVKWLLYHPDGLGLPKQYKDRKITTNATAIAKLLANPKVRDRDGVTELLVAIKEVQHERKVRSTFLFEKHPEKVDGDGSVHPPYRLFGAGTGRTAGGADDATADRRPDPYSFNVLNIPEDQRDIYVPHAERSCGLPVRHTPLTGDQRSTNAEDD